MNPPKHGQERNRREETEYGKPTTLVNATTGAEIHSGPVSSHTRTVVERYCDGCGKWSEVKGVFGMIEWISVHDDHKMTDEADAEEEDNEPDCIPVYGGGFSTTGY